MTYQEALQKAAHFCAYQERTQQEVRNKLWDWQCPPQHIEEIISDLIQDNYINEERFAQTFAGGKFRVKKWGKRKIEQELRLRKLSNYCIRQGLKEIPEEDYEQTLLDWIEKKNQQWESENILLRKNKIAKFVISKGFESDLVWRKLNEFYD